MTIEQILCVNLGAIALLFVVLWVISLSLKDASIVDIFWGAGFVIVAWLSLWIGGAWSSRALVIVGLVSIWGLRLAIYLAWRNWGKPEDHRYASMRKRYGNRFPVVSLFLVFGLQAAVMWVVSLPVQVGIAKAGPWNAVAAVGAALWCCGLFFEAVGDGQLARFKADPANQGRVMNQGLWRYTRHPNYFGDFLAWWGLYLVAAQGDSWWWTIIGPLLMSGLLMRVSGVTLLESSLRDRLAGYDEYLRTTSAFFPLPPRRG